MKQVSKSKSNSLPKSNKNYGCMSYLVVLGAVFSLLSILTIPPVYAQNPTIIIGNGEGCEQEACLSNDGLIVAQGSTVTWKNQDEGIHSIISGSPDDGRNGQFTSGNILPNEQFSFTFATEGYNHYYCDGHPWMHGVILVV